MVVEKVAASVTFVAQMSMEWALDGVNFGWINEDIRRHRSVESQGWICGCG